jgi:magnesium transporter
LRYVILKSDEGDTQEMTDTLIRRNLKRMLYSSHISKDHSGLLENKCSLLLDATLGLISIEQNRIVKIFSVAAVIFLPPTLIASIYGMNFEYMPELLWKCGYPLSICLMIISVIIPITIFKRNGWL